MSRWALLRKDSRHQSKIVTLKLVWILSKLTLGNTFEYLMNIESKETTSKLWGSGGGLTLLQKQNV